MIFLFFDMLEAFKNHSVVLFVSLFWVYLISSCSVVCISISDQLWEHDNKKYYRVVNILSIIKYGPAWPKYSVLNPRFGLLDTPSPPSEYFSKGSG